MKAFLFLSFLSIAIAGDLDFDYDQILGIYNSMGGSEMVLHLKNQLDGLSPGDCTQIYKRLSDRANMVIPVNLICDFRASMLLIVLSSRFLYSIDEQDKLIAMTYGCCFLSRKGVEEDITIKRDLLRDLLIEVIR